jgi:hypothetical protein
MVRKHVFADEAGNFDFSKKVGASRYFILTTVSMDTCGSGDALAALRRQLTWDGHDVSNGFHATDDSHDVRMAVFNELATHDIRVDTVILDKPKAQPQTHYSESQFYKYAWFYHFKYVAPRLGLATSDELFVVGAAIETKKKRLAFHRAIQDVVAQVAPVSAVNTAFWPAVGEPCLQVADYCAWAMQRKWERGDDTWYQMIKPKVRSEFDLWRAGRTTYY